MVSFIHWMKNQLYRTYCVILTNQVKMIWNIANIVFPVKPSGIFLLLFISPKSKTWLHSQSSPHCINHSFTQYGSCRACKAGGKQGNVVNFPKDWCYTGQLSSDNNNPSHIYHTVTASKKKKKEKKSCGIFCGINCIYWLCFKHYSASNLIMQQLIEYRITVTCTGVNHLGSISSSNSTHPA